ncbi:MAG: hypothetical protein Ct9H300mP1_38250 [Planctomycetaceae bacterium]|nr:MAG: hypothetical protein Ct9H300mP1_38250 [Planctomycetaceae bacterium]
MGESQLPGHPAAGGGLRPGPGTTDIDLSTQPLGTDPDGNPVLLSEIWPSQAEIAEAIAGSMSPEMYIQRYGRRPTDLRSGRQFRGRGRRFDWDAQSTYVQEPPFFVECRTTHHQSNRSTPPG